MVGAVTEITLKVIEELALDFSDAKTIRQISQNIGKPYPNTHKAATQLIKENVLLKNVVGHAHPCQLNLKNPLCQSYLSILQARKSEDLLENPQLKKIAEELSRYPDILFVWQRKEDLLIITKEPVQKKDLRAKWITLSEISEFLDTINQHTLILGHSLYPALLENKLEEVFK